MLTHSVSIPPSTVLRIAASRSGAAGMSLTLFEGDVAQASVFVAEPDQGHLLLASLIDAVRHLHWLSEPQAQDMVEALHRHRRPWWRRWLGGTHEQPPTPGSGAPDRSSR